MSDIELSNVLPPDINFYENEILVRGSELSLQSIKASYRELAVLTRKEADRIVGSLVKPEEMDESEFIDRNQVTRRDAFRLTVSIIGFDGQTAFGDTEGIFNAANLPFPIRTIYFTNITAFKPYANGEPPPNRFQVWLHFDKPPLFDPNPLVSDPTPNLSKVDLRAEDVIYFRAVQNIVRDKLQGSRIWYSFIHRKFAYDLGLWLFAAPYALYWITVSLDRLLPQNQPYASFRVAGYIYGLGISLLLYRCLVGYFKWAFPVNVLRENKDKAFKHRVILGTALLSLIVGAIQPLISHLLPS